MVGRIFCRYSSCNHLQHTTHDRGIVLHNLYKLIMAKENPKCDENCGWNERMKSRTLCFGHRYSACTQWRAPISSLLLYPKTSQRSHECISITNDFFARDVKNAGGAVFQWVFSHIFRLFSLFFIFDLIIGLLNLCKTSIKWKSEKWF